MTPAITPNFSTFPAELRLLDQWVVWKYVKKDDGGFTKVPFRASDKSRQASSTNPATWGTFAAAKEAYESGGCAGVGFVLNGDGLVGIDLDGCVKAGVPDTAAMALLDSLGAAYVEVSPSGKGLRALGYGDSIKGVNGVADGLKGEFYSGGRYLTITGHTLRAGPLTALREFEQTAERFRVSKRTTVDAETGEIVPTPADQRHAALMASILAGEVYHDSLRDLAASLVASGLNPAATVAHLQGLMDASNGAHDVRWVDRRAQIPELVNSAHAKFAVQGFEDVVEQSRAASSSRYKLLGRADLAALPPLAWRVRGVLPAAGLAGLYGPSASGKSFLALDMAAAIAEGGRWFDCRVHQAPVVYVALEGEAGFKLRAQAWESAGKRNLPDGLQLVLQPFKLTEVQDLADLAAVVPTGAVVILDTLNRAAPTVDENSSRDMGQILEAAKRLQAEIGGLVVLVHHTGKDTTKGARGHSSLFAAFDAAIEVTRTVEQRSWKVAKAKDGQDGFAHDFLLGVVPLGHDADGEPISSCVVQQVAEPFGQQRALSPGLENAMAAFHAAKNLFSDGVSVERDDWRREFYAITPTKNPEANRQAFGRAVKNLTDDEHVIQNGDVFTLNETIA